MSSYEEFFLQRNWWKAFVSHWNMIPKKKQRHIFPHSTWSLASQTNLRGDVRFLFNRAHPALGGRSWASHFLKDNGWVSSDVKLPTANNTGNCWRTSIYDVYTFFFFWHEKAVLQTILLTLLIKKNNGAPPSRAGPKFWTWDEEATKSVMENSWPWRETHICYNIKSSYHIVCIIVLYIVILYLQYSSSIITVLYGIMM